jgi:SAM-dependent methyltransferase
LLLSRRPQSVWRRVPSGMSINAEKSSNSHRLGRSRADRYPQIFQFARDQLEDRSDVRLLSFGCSTGEEVFSLRRYFPAAQIRGLDINPLNVAACLRGRRRAGDARMSFAVAGSVEDEPSGSYDAIFCMAVLRDGELSDPRVLRCDHRITFAAFERTLSDLARCLKDGGLLIVQHSNFRFCDAATAAHFQALLTVDNQPFHERTPLFGPDNRRLDVPPYGEVVFREVAGPSKGGSA